MQTGWTLCPGLAGASAECASRRTTQTTLARSPAAAASLAVRRLGTLRLAARHQLIRLRMRPWGGCSRRTLTVRRRPTDVRAAGESARPAR